jgi:outer membrane lipoprotein-sorting protein
MILARRKILALAALLAAAPTSLLAVELSADDTVLVNRAVAYLEGLTNAKGRFEQTDWRGVVAGGEFYVARPGRARFDYDPPSALTLTSDGRTVTLTNPKLKTVQRYPLNATPLGLFLAKEIRLDRGVRILAVRHDSSGFAITVCDQRAPAQGQITLDFADAPLRLTGWSITDAQRRTSRLALRDFGPTTTLSADLFTQSAPPTP